MIYFLMSLFKGPQIHSIYWAIDDARAVVWVLGQPIAYFHVTRDANCIIDNMSRQILEVWATITLWDGQVPEDAPRNQLQDVYKQQGEKQQLD